LDLLRDTPTRPVLLPEHGDQVDEPSGFLKAWQQVVFFQLLVVIHDETPNELCRADEHRRVQVLPGAEPAYSLLIEEKDAVKHALFAH
jgi:hypothetical protein